MTQNLFFSVKNIENLRFAVRVVGLGSQSVRENGMTIVYSCSFLLGIDRADVVLAEIAQKLHL